MASFWIKLAFRFLEIMPLVATLLPLNESLLLLCYAFARRVKYNPERPLNARLHHKWGKSKMKLYYRQQYLFPQCRNEKHYIDKEEKLFWLNTISILVYFNSGVVAHLCTRSITPLIKSNVFGLHRIAFKKISLKSEFYEVSACSLAILCKCHFFSVFRKSITILNAVSHKF